MNQDISTAQAFVRLSFNCFAIGLALSAAFLLNSGLKVFAKHLAGAERISGEKKTSNAAWQISGAFFLFILSIIIMLW